jgi:hypothetical protein
LFRDHAAAPRVDVNLKQCLTVILGEGCDAGVPHRIGVLRHEH